MKEVLRHPLRNTGFILFLAIFYGLIFNQGAYWMQSTVLPILIIIMTISLLGIPSEILLNIKKLIAPAMLSLFLNYFVLSAVLIGVSSLVIHDREFWIGFVIMATVPPAVSVIPYTYILGGDTNFSLTGSMLGYLAALFITPLYSILFLGTNYIKPMKLLTILATLILIPLFTSRLLRQLNLGQTILKFRSPVVNWGFFLITYIIIGLNRNTFLHRPVTLLRLALVVFISTFVLSYLINTIARLFRVNKENRISFMLMGTRKNYSLAAAIALVFFTPNTATPIAIGIIFAILHFIWLNFWVRKMR